jgi:hypothetical protein
VRARNCDRQSLLGSPSRIGRPGKFDSCAHRSLINLSFYFCLSTLCMVCCRPSMHVTHCIRVARFLQNTASWPMPEKEDTCFEH